VVLGSQLPGGMVFGVLADHENVHGVALAGMQPAQS
jgi:hypothetical protein